MTTNRVLGHLARRFAVSEENIATEALTWLLKSPAARSALIGLARTTGTALPDDLTFIGQVGNPETGRPDIVGTDSQGRERLVIEAKFAAGLTPQQPNGYLERLDAGGVLLVVAPNARRASLWVELLRAVPGVVAPAPSTVPTKGLLRLAINPTTTLALVDWRSLVGRVLDALSASGDAALARDAEQLLDLTEVMDDDTFVEVGPGDLTQRTGTQVAQLHLLIDPTYRTIVADPASLAKPYSSRTSHGRIFYGWYLRSKATGKVLWFGFLPRAWGSHGLSPLWIQVKVSESWSRQRLAEALSFLNEAGQPGVFEDGDFSFLIPLTIPHFTGGAEIAKDLQRQIENVFTTLDAAVAPGEHPVPEEVVAPESE